MTWIHVMEGNEASSPLREAYATARGARGKVSNILRVHSVHPAAMTAHLGLYVELMFAPSELSRAEREAIAAAVSSSNECHY